MEHSQMYSFFLHKNLFGECHENQIGTSFGKMPERMRNSGVGEPDAEFALHGIFHGREEVLSSYPKIRKLIIAKISRK